jgi:HKD family nuclease
MKGQSVELLRELQENTEEYDNAIMATRSYEPQFFESRILRLLRHTQGVTNTVVLVEHSTYNDSTAARQAGITYFVEPVSVPGTFHPKVTLLTSEEGGKLFVGSANLNQEAYTRSAEAVTMIEYEKAGSSQLVEHSLLLDASKFFQRLIDTKLVRSSKHAGKIKEALNVDWLGQEREQTQPNSSARLFHNVDEPLWNQAMAVIGKETVLELTVISPFFDGDSKMLHELSNSAKNVRLMLDPVQVSGLDKTAVSKLSNVRTYKLSFDQQIGRYLHAKIFLFKTKSGSFCLTGSSNATTPALLCTSKNGNVEVDVLRFEPNQHYFDYLFLDGVTVTPLSLANIRPRPIEAKSSEYHPIDLYEARIERGKLILEYECSQKLGLGGKVQLQSVVKNRVTVACSLTHVPKVEILLDSGLLEYCRFPTLVKLESKSDDASHGWLSSNERWISNDIQETVDLIPRSMDTLRRTAGRMGFFPLVKKLWDINPSMIPHLLEYLDFSDLYESLRSQRRRLLKRLNLVDQESSGDTDWPAPPKPADLLQRITATHTRKMLKVVESLDIREKDFPDKFEKLVNLFILLSRFAVFVVLEGKAPPDKLSPIPGLMRTIFGIPEIQETDPSWVEEEGVKAIPKKVILGRNLMHDMRSTLRPSNYDALLDKTNLISHLSIISYTVHSIHERQNPSWKSNNKTVIMVFLHAYETALANVCRNGDAAVTLKRATDRIPQTLEEYDVENAWISLDPSEIVSFLMRHSPR